MLNQISLFAANTKGALSKITSVLAQDGINIYTMLMHPFNLWIYRCCSKTSGNEYNIHLFEFFNILADKL